MERACADEGVTFLRAGQQLFVGGYRFVGDILWSGFDLYGTPDESKRLASQGISDFHLMGVDGRLWTPDDAASHHRGYVKHLQRVLAKPTPTVVVTHFLPSPGSIDKRYAGNSLNPYYCTDLDELMRANPHLALWVHGHSHHRADHVVGVTRVVCNPRGYPSERGNGFDSGFVVDLPELP